MELKPMFQAQTGSPVSYLANAITETDTSITLTDITNILEPPNLLTIQNDENFETIKYTEINGNVISGITRGFDNTIAKSFEAESNISRKFTAYDQNTIHENINILSENTGDFGIKVIYNITANDSTDLTGTILTVNGQDYELTGTSDTVEFKGLFPGASFSANLQSKDGYVFQETIADYTTNVNEMTKTFNLQIVKNTTYFHLELQTNDIDINLADVVVLIKKGEDEIYNEPIGGSSRTYELEPNSDFTLEINNIDGYIVTTDIADISTGAIDSSQSMQYMIVKNVAFFDLTTESEPLTDVSHAEITIMKDEEVYISDSLGSSSTKRIELLPNTTYQVALSDIDDYVTPDSFEITTGEIAEITSKTVTYNEDKTLFNLTINTDPTIDISSKIVTIKQGEDVISEEAFGDVNPKEFILKSNLEYTISFENIELYEPIEDIVLTTGSFGTTIEKTVLYNIDVAYLDLTLSAVPITDVSNQIITIVDENDIEILSESYGNVTPKRINLKMNTTYTVSFQDLANYPTPPESYTFTTGELKSVVSYSALYQQIITVVVGTSTEGHTTAEADYICNGTNDEVTINEAIQSLKGIDDEVKCKFLSGTYNISASINIDINDLIVEMDENTIILSDMMENSTTITNILTRNKIFTVNANNIIFSGGQIKNEQSSNITIYCESGSIANIENINVDGVACGIAVNTDSELVAMADNTFNIIGLGTGTCGIYNTGTTGDISGDWTVSGNSNAYGIYNYTGTTGDISGDWTVSSSGNSNAYGINNYKGTTGDISGDWTVSGSSSSTYGINNNTGTTGDISGDWTVSSSSSTFGIYNTGTTEDISGDWTVSSSSGSNAYGINNTGTTGDISGDWTVSGSSSTFGIYNTGTTGDISGDWTVSGNSNAYGIRVSTSKQNNITISNATAKSTYGTDNTAGYPIHISNTNALSTYIITNNVLNAEPVTSGSATFDVRDNIITG